MNEDTQRPALWSSDFIRICMANFMVFTGFYFIVPTLPIYVMQLGGTEAIVGFVAGAFTFSALGTRPWAGRALDIWGRRTVYLAALILFIITAVSYQWAGSVAGLFALRVFHGFSWGATGTAAGTIVADIVPTARRGEGMGFFGLSTNLAMIVGPAAGIAMVGKFGFPILFTLTGLCALVALALAAGIRYRPVKTPEPGGRLIEPAVLPLSAILFFTTIIYGGVMTFITLYALERGITNAGPYFTILAGALLLVRPVAGVFYDRYGSKVVIVPGLMLIIAAMVTLSLAVHPVPFFASAVLMGAGFGAVQPTLQAIAVTVAGPHRRGTATATLMLGMDLGMATGAMVLGLVAQAAGYSAMYIFSAIGGILALALYILKEHRPAVADGRKKDG